LDEHLGVAEALAEALPHVAAHAGRTIVVKVGGSTLGSHDTTLEDVVTLQQLRVDVVLVHGGGSAISGWLKRIGKEPKFVNGLRVTDEETMEVVLMTLGGQVNKALVGGIQAKGGRALGLCGIDGGLIRGVQKDPLLGQVGEVTAVDAGMLRSILAAGYVPVIAPIAAGECGEPLNLNADTAAGAVAGALGAAKLIFLTDVPGVKGASGELLPRLDEAKVRELIASGVISGGMIPKVEACLRGLEGVPTTHIIDGRLPHALIRELYTDEGVGTMITK
jgi:acetylglutamate kinase